LFTLSVLMVAVGVIPLLSGAAPEMSRNQGSYVQVDVRKVSLSQCPSGYLCLWSSTNYTGSFAKYANSGSYADINLPTVRSLWNNRSKRSFIYSGYDGRGSSACYGPGARTTSLSGWRILANSVYVSSTTYCSP